MCVAITLAPGGVLTATEIERMNRANADGVGIAWAHDGIVQWFKTTKVDTEYVRKVIQSWAAYPRLVHFRYTTAGGTRPELCHPFEVGPTANCHPVGVASKVMIHNGHWGRWQDVKDLLEKEGLLPDKGPWSDSRLAAYLAHGDPDWFEALGGRVAVMSGNGETRRLGDWKELREGVWVSNKNWDTTHVYTRGGYSGYRNWKGWQWNDAEWEAFERDQEEKAQRELEEHIKELEAAAEAKRLKAEARAEAKKAKRAEKAEKEARDAKKSGKGGGATGAATREKGAAPACGEPRCLETTGGWGCGDEGVCAVSRSSVSAVSAVDPQPVYCNGKWYQAVNIRGTTEVVEVAPPGAEGAAGS